LSQSGFDRDSQFQQDIEVSLDSFDRVSICLCVVSICLDVVLICLEWFLSESRKDIEGSLDSFD
jgi:hypothetical protein